MVKKFLEYLQLEKNYSPLTIKSYEKDLLDLKNFLFETEGLSDIENASKKQLRNFLVFLSNQKISKRTINRKISSVRSFFKFLLRIGYLKTTPASNLHNLKPEKRVLIPYTEEEIRLLKNNINEIENMDSSDFEKVRNQLIFDFFYQTGIRRIELIKLKTSKINLNDKTITIIGKRNKERLIPITQELKESIARYLTIKSKNVNILNEYFFTDDKGQVLEEKFVYKLINRYLSSVTTKEKKSPHMLRHTFASHLLHNGAELNSIKEILGHSSLAATQIYTHSDIEDLKRVFNQSHPFGLKNKEK